MQNIDYELKIIYLLGYTIKETEENKWDILDENKNIVGYIHKTLTGFETQINDAKIRFNISRSFNDLSNTKYHFYVTREDITYKIELDFGTSPSVIINHKALEVINFSHGKNGLIVKFEDDDTKEQTKDKRIAFNYNEIGDNKFQKMYSYNSVAKEDSSTTIVNVFAHHDSRFQSPNIMEATYASWENGEIKKAKKATMLGDVGIFAIKHQVGLEAFEKFRNKLNALLPFKQDILTALLENSPYTSEKLLGPFLTDVTSNLKKKFKLKETLSTFNSKFIGEVISELISRVEAQEYIYYDGILTHKTKNDENFINSTLETQNQTRAIATPAAILWNAYSSKISFDEVVATRQGLLLEKNSNTMPFDNQRITFYEIAYNEYGKLEIVPSFEFAQFPYVKYLIDSLIAYRINNKTMDISKARISEIISKIVAAYLERDIHPEFHEDILTSNLINK